MHGRAGQTVQLLVDMVIVIALESVNSLYMKVLHVWEMNLKQRDVICSHAQVCTAITYVIIQKPSLLVKFQ